MKPPIVIFALLLLLSFPCLSQSDYRDGYIVTNNADTIFGLLNYRGSKANTTECKFRKTKKSDVINYTPNDIKAYRFIDGKYFISHLIDTKRVFIEFLINGTVDVYYYRDDLGEHYLVSNDDNTLTELKYGDIEYFVGSQRYTRKNNSYQGVLKANFAKSPTITKRVEDINITHKSLIKIAKDYHNEVCSNETCIIYEKHIPKSIFTWGPILSYNVYTVNNRGGRYPEQVYFLEGTDFSPQRYLSYGLFIRQSIPSLNERLFYSIETTFHQRSFETANRYDYQEGQTTYYTNYIKYKISAINTTILLRYEFPRGAFRPVFIGGVFNDLPVSRKYSRVRGHHIGASETVVVMPDENPFTGLNYGFVGGLGLAFKIYKKHELLIDARYHYALGDFDLYSDNLKVRNVDVGLKFTL
jgi:hypothetical protein